MHIYVAIFLCKNTIYLNFLKYKTMFCYASAVSQISNIKIYTHNCEKIDGVRKKSGENKNAWKVCIEILFIFKISPP